MSRAPRRLGRCVLVVWIGCCATLHAEVLNPLTFESLGTLNLSSGSFTIDTNALVIVDDAAPGTPLFTGVIDDQRGLADSFGPGGDVTTVGALGIPHVAVFTFDAIDLASTANITVTGHRALALLSQGNALVDTRIDVRGVNGVQGNVVNVALPPGLAVGGGFDGGQGIRNANGENGFGPGGSPGLPTTAVSGASAGGASFGSTGSGIAFPAGPIYGDLTDVLQGGSGGGGTGSSAPAGGGAGGGALEIAAAGKLTIGPAGELLAAGGSGGYNEGGGLGRRSGGAGSGGGIRLHAALFESAGSILATGGPVDSPNPSAGGGGRVLIYGMNSTLAVGEDLPDPAALGVNVAAGTTLLNHGVVVVSPNLTIVPAGQSLQLGGPPVVLQEASTTQPRIELLHRDVRADGGAELIVPTGGFTNQHRIEFGGSTARITGSDPLTNTAGGELRGSGSVEVELINNASGQVNAINDTLMFTQAATNNAGGQINAINGTFTFPGDGMANDDGLVNLGTLNLINTTINGDVRSPAGSTINVAGAATFNGFVSGAADFSGTENLITFNGGFAPGDSAAEVSFGGDVALGTENRLRIELGGTTRGTEYDSLQIDGDAVLSGVLDVSLIDGFNVNGGAVFEILTTGGRIAAGMFTTEMLPPLANDLRWNVLYTTNSVVLEVVAPMLPGDYNQNGVVDAADHTVWQDTLGATIPAGTGADGDGDGVIDSGDYTVWKTNFGNAAGSGSIVADSDSSAVPETSTLVILLIAMSLCGVCGRRC